VDVIGGRLLHEAESAGRKRSAFVAIGEDSVVELVQPLSATSVEARDLEQNGEGIHALVFKTRDLARATECLRSKNLPPRAAAEGLVALDRGQAFGMVIGFTDRAIPNDPR
ncbi:MAG: hypothetical protein ACRETH_00480, partial [Steroidobacteraceae bacterium]